MSMATDARIGSELAGYRIEVPIGRGGMGVVYRAEQLRLGRKVALKLLAPELAENQGFYLFSELAPLLPASVPVVLAYDFSLEPERLAALRRTAGGLSGVTDGTPISEVLETLRK